MHRHLAGPPSNRSTHAAQPANRNTMRASGRTNQEEGGAGQGGKGSRRVIVVSTPGWQGLSRGYVPWQLARPDGGLASGPELTAAGHAGCAGYTGHTGERAVFAQ